MSLHDKAVASAKRYLIINGYEIEDLDQSASKYFDIAAWDPEDECACMVKVFEIEERMPETKLSRSKAEEEAIHILAYFYNKEGETRFRDVRVRFDIIALYIADDKECALLVHHINCLGKDDN